MNNSEYKNQLIRRTFAYSLNVIRLIDTLSKNDFTVEILAKQLLRSATSVGANIIEAQAASSRKDFINFLNYALKSSNESNFWLVLIRNAGKGDKERINLLLQETDEIGRILGSTIVKLKSKNLNS